MRRRYLAMPAHSSVATIALCMLAAPAAAQEAPKEATPLTAWEASRTTDSGDMVTTGVARGRDRLDSPTSTSSIKENDIVRLAPRSLAELFRYIPGIRVEAGIGEVLNNYTVRGLPMVNGASKYIQLQEDGLPVMEFGDLARLTPDLFIRADLNIAQVESIRGGSASTFASNAPGGVINLISKTGEVQGGSVMATVGVDYESYRTDFDYGGHLGNGWRFHIGGFYREGEGPRATGMDSMRGGQVKLNITKQFEGGYVRVYGKLLDDKVPVFAGMPLLVTGTNADPSFADTRGLNSRSESLLSPYMPTDSILLSSGSPRYRALSDGLASQAKAIGFEGQISLGEWSITDRFRYANQTSSNTTLVGSSAAAGATLARAFGGAGAAFSYASGPNAGKAFDATRGNGLAVLSLYSDMDAADVSNMTNDLRVSRVWPVGGGNLTTTAGLYRSSQTYVSDVNYMTFFQDAQGGSQSVALNLRTAAGVLLTQDGVRNYGSPGAPGNSKRTDVTYTTTAPFASLNFAKGKVAIGGSVRWDNSRARGNIANDKSFRTFDMNGDGTISTPERLVAFVPVGLNLPVNYRHNYVSYSGSVNYRVAQSLAVFGRYSLGARAGADKILFTPAVSTVTGALVNTGAGDDTVRQGEIGLKFRNNGIVLNLTAFHALTDDTNSQIFTNPATGQPEPTAVTRAYKAYGLEFEGGFRRGQFNLIANATYVKADIRKAETPALIGNTPRNQPNLIYGLTPQFDTDLFTIGASFIGNTASYTQDVNMLRMPGYTTVGAFAQVRPAERFELTLNVSNLLNTLAITSIAEGAIPASGVVLARPLYGRTISASGRFFF